MENLFKSFVQSMRMHATFNIENNEKMLRLIGIVDTERAIMNEVKAEEHTTLINRIDIATYEESLKKLFSSCTNFAEQLEGEEKSGLIELINKYENKYHEIKNEDMARQICDERVMVNE